MDEIIRGTNIALGYVSPAECPAIDSNHDFAVTVEEVIAAIVAALNGCQ